MSKKMMLAIAVTVGFAVARLFVVQPAGLDRGDIFKDIAHLWVGGLWGAAYVKWTDKTLWIAAAGLTAAEVVAFFAKS